MPRVLILAPTLPYPPRANGLSIRMAPVLERISQDFEIHLIVAGDERRFYDDAMESVKSICTSVTILPGRRSPLQTRLGLIQSIGVRPYPPLRILREFTRDLVQRASSILSGDKNFQMLAFGDSHSHALCNLIRKFPNVPSTIDWVDSPALHIKRSIDAGEREKPQDLHRVAAWERFVNSVVDRVIYISTPDAQFANHGQTDGKIHVVPNGVFDIENTCERPGWRSPLSALPKVTLGFLGNMGYSPNHLAAIRLVDEVLPSLELGIANLDIRVKIIGRHPQDDLLARRSARVAVTGEVASIWPELEEVDVFVFPMTRGAGLQNKILEALRARRPVIASRICAASLPNSSDHGVVVADSPDEIAHALLDIVLDQSKLQRLQVLAAAYTDSLRAEAIAERYRSVLLS